MFKPFLLIVFATVVLFNTSLENSLPKNQTTQISSLYISPTLEPISFSYIIITETPVPTTIPTLTSKLTTTPSPVIMSFQLSVSALDTLFNKYADNYKVDRNLLKKIALCESNLNSSARFGDYGGLYQFSSSAWIVTRRNMNLDDNLDLRFNSDEAIKTAAYKIKSGGLDSWPNCSK